MTDAPVRPAKDDLAKAMTALIATMAKAIVELPDSVSVRNEAEHEGTAILLRVASRDLGKVIGKQGRTARSMRTILAAASMKTQHRFSLDIQQDDGEDEHPTPAETL